jgi:DNA-binding MarR family transcriptional regulator
MADRNASPQHALSAGPSKPDTNASRRPATAQTSSSPYRGSHVEAAIGYLLRRAESVAAAMYYERIGDSDLTHRQFAVLSTLEHYGRMTQTELAARIRIDRSTINEMMPRLQERGLVIREPSPLDKRAVEVELTPEGRRTHEEVLPAVLDASEVLLSILPAEYRRIFRHCLEMIVDSDERAPTAEPS